MSRVYLSGSININEPIVIEEIGYGVHGDGSLFEIPLIIEFKDAVVTFADNGMISTLVCDYSQTMDFGDRIVVSAGQTTWTFADFGTTVIE